METRSICWISKGRIYNAPDGSANASSIALVILSHSTLCSIESMHTETVLYYFVTGYFWVNRKCLSPLNDHANLACFTLATSQKVEPTGNRRARTQSGNIIITLIKNLLNVLPFKQRGIIDR